MSALLLSPDLTSQERTSELNRLLAYVGLPRPQAFPGALSPAAKSVAVQMQMLEAGVTRLPLVVRYCHHHHHHHHHHHRPCRRLGVPTTTAESIL
jgi:hypothetical protein